MNISESLKMANLKVKEPSSFLMVMFIQVSLEITNIMEMEGIEFFANADVGGKGENSVSMDDLDNSNDVVLLTTGATKPRDLPIPQREGNGVHFAMDFLRTKMSRRNYLCDLPH